MSLINDVLRDLDRRRAAPRDRVPAGVSVPARVHSRGPWRRFALAGGGVVVVAAAGVFLLDQPTSGPRPAAVQTPVPVPERTGPVDASAAATDEVTRLPRLERVDLATGEDTAELRFLTERPLVHALERDEDGTGLSLALPVRGDDTPELPDVLGHVPNVAAVDWRVHEEVLTLELRFSSAPRVQARRLRMPPGVALELDFPQTRDDVAIADQVRTGDDANEGEGANEKNNTSPGAGRAADDGRDGEAASGEALAEAPLGIPAAVVGDATSDAPIKRPARAVDTDGILRRAASMREEGRLDDAVSIYREALEREPQAWRLRRALAATLDERGDQGDAVAVLTDGLEYERGAPRLARAKARLVMDDDPARAIRVLEAHPAPTFGEGHWHALLAALYRRTGQAEDAVPLYRQLAREQSDDARWWLGLGVALEESGEEGRARAAYERALSVGGLDSELTAFLRQRIETLE